MLPDILNKKFNKEEHQSNGYLLPEGACLLNLIKWTAVTVSGNTKIDLTFVITNEGKFNKRKLKQFWYVEHTNKKTVEISYQKIASLTEAAGIEDDSLSIMLDQLVGHDLYVDIGISKGKNGYSDSNNIRFAYKEGVVPDKLIGQDQDHDSINESKYDHDAGDNDIPF